MLFAGYVKFETCFVCRHFMFISVHSWMCSCCVCLRGCNVCAIVGVQHGENRSIAGHAIACVHVSVFACVRTRVDSACTCVCLR